MIKALHQHFHLDQQDNLWPLSDHNLLRNVMVFCLLFVYLLNRFPEIKKKRNVLNVLNKTNEIEVRVMVFNATFNNISVIMWQSVLLLEETLTRVSRKKRFTEQLYHIMLYRVQLATWESQKSCSNTEAIGLCDIKHIIRLH